MSSSNQQEWQQKIKNLKLGNNNAAPEKSTPAEPIIPEILSGLDGELFEAQAWQEKIAATKNWFELMPSSGKIAVAVGLAIGGLMLLKTVFQLVTSLMTLGVVAVVLWFGYRYFIGSKVDGGSN
jgi:hypothetical protein